LSGKLNFIRKDNIKILLIDNTQENIDTVTQILTEKGYEVTTADSAERGLAVAKRIVPDVILLDAVMPDISGYDICRRIKSDPKVKDIPVIFLRDIDGKGDLQEGFAAGAVDYITMPFVKDELLARVRVHTELAIKSRQEAMLAEMLDKYALEIIIDTTGTIKYVSTAFLRLTGYEVEELIDRSFDFLKHPDSFRSMLPDILDSVMNKFTYYKEIDLRTKSGDKFIVNTFAEPLKTQSGEVKGAQCFMSDVTSKKELERLSITDKLTGLNNRLKLDQVLRYELSQFQRYGTSFSVILMDLDDFKKVNDTYGHITGDKVLIKLADILRENVRDSDTCGRWGGEEFLIIVPKANEEEAAHVAEKLRRNIEEEKFSIEKPVTASVGVACIEADSSITKLLSNADKALYKAKKSGKNIVVKASES
jgi:diguanylate cyclase (GGDEF)-like protein/PAS domain S-box-containing protein